MRRVTLALVLASALLLAGCVGGPASSADPSTQPAESTTSPATTSPATSATDTPPTPAGALPDGPREYPDPPTDLTEESAKRVALAHEEAVVYNALAARDYAEFGATASVTSEEATVLRHADGGIYLRVHHPFWFTMERTEGNRTVQTHADGGTTAIYYVSTDAVIRVEVERGVP